MNDEEFDELLRDATVTYNLPPAPPREAMWDAISSARSSQGVVPMRPARRSAPWLLGSAAAVAVLMLGIAIGRQSRDGDVASVRVASATPTAPAVTRPNAPIDTSASETNPPASARADALDVASREPERRELHTAFRLPRRLATNAPRSRISPNGSPNDSFNDADAYRLAVIEHLTRTEVLLTDFRTEARSGTPAKLDAQFAAVSRELLGTTRMLLATRRGEDPVMTRLLQDLEYVLMQLSQYANDGRGVDLDAINQSIDRRNVLPKLRYSIPAGVSASAGT